MAKFFLLHFDIIIINGKVRNHDEIKRDLSLDLSFVC